ncbi:hypothetical protein EVAR_101196_1 [Eumeta japonica]|uniref:Uncharacterized protein n=1 Tax=Eumeta variegata TaxID=151549 RepID=A0A4C1TGC4_EUMVA|nr:hypothetical protein EVAR_101196_1 [Eumeta japonica]
MFGNITAIGKPSEVKKLLEPNISLDTNLEELIQHPEAAIRPQKSTKGNKISSTLSIYWIRGTIFIWSDHSDSNRLAKSMLQQKKFQST